MKKAVTNIFEVIEKTVAVILSIGLVATVFYGVLVRYLPISGKQMAWSQEVAQLLLVWFAFFTIAMVQRKNEHFSVDIILSKLPGISKLIGRIFVYSLSIAFFVFVGINAFNYMESLTGITSTILRFPLILLPLSLMICSFLAVVYTVNTIFKTIKYRREVK